MSLKRVRGGLSKPNILLMSAMMCGSSPRAPRYVPLVLGAEASLAPAPVMRPVVSPLPFSSAIICSTGPPGANCTTTKLIAMMPNSVGNTSSRRRMRYAVIQVGQVPSPASPVSLLLCRLDRSRLGRVHPPCVEVEALADRLVGMTEAVPIGDVE